MKQRRKNPSGIGSMTAFMLTAAACSQVLGIDEAHVDPSLTTGSPTVGGSGGTGGPTGMAGSSGGTAGSGGAA